MKRRVVIVDDHRLFRVGLKQLLEGQGFEVVGEAGDGAEAVRVVRRVRPELVLMDLLMPGVGGLEATRLIKAEFPEVGVVVLTASEEEADLFEAIKSGAQGYLLKSYAPETVIELLKAAAEGQAALTPALAAKILAEFSRLGARREGAEPVEPLTAREREVLELVVAGASNKEIARRLFITENTVKYHLKNILQKLHAHNRAQVVAFALRHGIVKPPSERQD